MIDFEIVPPPDRHLPKYAPLLAARHAAHGPELFRFLHERWAGRNLDVLDVACGDGFYTASFASLLGDGGRVTAVDVLPGFLEWTERRIIRMQTTGQRSWDRASFGEQVHFVRADAGRLPFPDACFDLVWCAQSLNSLPDSPAALREMRRVVRLGGHVGILENDRLHEIRLPWPVDLELAVRSAEQQRSRPSKQNAGRYLSSLARRAGLTPVERRTLVIDRAVPLQPADAAFLRLYLQALVDRVESRLNPVDAARLRRLALPESPDFLAGWESFWMTWSDMILIARRDS